jgi:hypothetical protein
MIPSRFRKLSEKRIPTDTEDDDFRFEMSPFEQRRPVPFRACRSVSDRPNVIATHPALRGIGLNEALTPKNYQPRILISRKLRTPG